MNCDNFLVLLVTEVCDCLCFCLMKHWNTSHFTALLYSFTAPYGAAVVIILTQMKQYQLDAASALQRAICCAAVQCTRLSSSKIGHVHSHTALPPCLPIHPKPTHAQQSMSNAGQADWDSQHCITRARP